LGSRKNIATHYAGIVQVIKKHLMTGESQSGFLPLRIKEKQSD
jgi:hypothetical protein